MAGKLLVESKTPISQSIEAVKAFLSWRKMPTDPMPITVELPGVVLVLGSKKDIYYTTTANDCSCPARCYHPAQRCKHQKKFFARDEAMPHGEFELMNKVGFRPCLE